MRYGLAEYTRQQKVGAKLRLPYTEPFGRAGSPNVYEKAARGAEVRAIVSYAQQASFHRKIARATPLAPRISPYGKLSS